MYNIENSVDARVQCEYVCAYAYVYECVHVHVCVV